MNARRLRPSQKVALLGSVAAELGKRYGFPEIDMYLREFAIETPISFNDYNETDYARYTMMRGIDDATLIEMAQDLELPLPAGGAHLSPPSIWQNSQDFRLFISHIAEEKEKAMRLKDCLQPYAIAAFVAHEDIEPTQEWELEIRRALNAMDAFLSIHTRGFANSVWTQQEVGFAVARDVKIISLDMGELPDGFLSKHQALARRKRPAEEIAREVDIVLANDDRTYPRLAEAKQARNPVPKGFDKDVDDEIPF